MDDGADSLRGIRRDEHGHPVLKQVRFFGGRIDAPGRDELADELAAFANSSGGVVVLGASDEGRDVTGLAQEHLVAVERYVEEAGRDCIVPPMLPVVERMELGAADGSVVKVEVPPGRFVYQSPGGYLHRVGGSKRELEAVALVRLLEERDPTGAGRFEEHVINGASMEDLDPRLVDRFVTAVGGEERTAALVKLNMIAEDEAGVLRPTAAGLLFGARLPQRWLPQAFIQSVAYRGESVSSAMRGARYQLDAKDNDGPIDDQVEYACRFVARNQRVEASKHMGRRDWPQYDLPAVFEAVVNAVAHRDYSIRGSKVRLRMYSDRIELYSPGALPEYLGVGDLARKRIARNPAIANLLARRPVPEGVESCRSTLMGRKGDGVPAIVARSRGLSGREPVYELFGRELRLTIWAAEPGVGDATRWRHAAEPG